MISNSPTDNVPIQTSSLIDLQALSIPKKSIILQEQRQGDTDFKIFVLDRTPMATAEGMEQQGTPPPEPKANGSVSGDASGEDKAPVPEGAEGANSGGSSGGPPALVLPPGVALPDSVDPSLIDGRLRNILFQLPPEQINNALIEYDDAVKTKDGQIRNHKAYLFGVVKRYANVQEKASGSYANGRPGEKPMGNELTQQVKERLQKMIDVGFCKQEDLTVKVVAKLKMLTERDAMAAIEEISAVERAQIRNFGSYFMGILNRYMRGEKTPQQHRDHYGPGPGRRGGQTMSEQHPPRHDTSVHGRDSFDSDRGGTDRRFNDRDRRDERTYSRDGRGRSPDRGYMQDSPRSHHRDRDNDRYNSNRHRREGRERSRDRYDHYDDRDRGSGRRGDRRRSSRNDDYDNRSPRRSDFSYRDRDRRDRSDRGLYSDPSRRSSSHRDGRPQSADAPYHGAMQPGFGDTQNQQTTAFPPPPPPPRGVPPPPQQQAAVPVSGTFQQQQQAQQQFLQQSQTQPYVAQLPHQTQQQPPVQVQAPQQQFLSQPVNSLNHQPVPVPDPGFVAQGGFAPPSSSLVAGQSSTYSGAQHLLQQPSFALPNQPSAVLHSYQGTAPVAAPAASFTNSNTKPQSEWQTSTTDILGIADKAASVVQALASQNAAMQTTQSMPAQQYSVPQVGQQQPQAFEGGNRDAGPPTPSRVRSVASVNDLPVMVGYAVKNLQATGYLGLDLDAGILGMIGRLPEPVALQALEKFSSCDQSTMRNKTAYLAGILKRELERQSIR